MKEILVLLIPAAVGAAAVRAMLLPMKWGMKLALHAGAGFVCLWLLNLAQGVTGFAFPINPVTTLTAGALGLPGIAAMALLAVTG